MTDGLAQADGDLAWVLPQHRPATGTAPVLSVDGFEGPIDFLVAQSRAGRINLAQLSIVELVGAIADALAAALDGVDKRPATLMHWGNWLVMAVDLALLRSRLLLPADSSEGQPADEEAEGLRHQIQQRAGIAAAVDWLGQRHQLGRNVWVGGLDRGGLRRDGRIGDVTGLMRACLMVLRVPEEAQTAFRVALPFWSPADAMGRIRDMLEEIGENGVAMEALLPEVPAGLSDHGLRCRAAMASTLVAGLELAREGVLTMGHTEPPTGTIMLARIAAAPEHPPRTAP